MAFQFRIYYKIFLKQFGSKEIGAVEPTTRHALHMEAQAYATAERRRQVEFGAGLRQRRLLGRLSFPLFVVTLEWTNSTGGSGDAVLVIAEVVAGGYTDASACEILRPGRKQYASGISGQRRSRRS